MKKFRLLIAGSRGFNSYYILNQQVEMILSTVHYDDVEIVSGGANGADKLGERFAMEHQLPVKRFLPDWDKHGKAAGPIRNEQMAKYATNCIIFWDGKSKGTKNMIDLCNKHTCTGSILKYSDAILTNVHECDATKPNKEQEAGTIK